MDSKGVEVINVTNPNCPNCGTKTVMKKMKHPAKDFPRVGFSRFWVCPKCRGEENLWKRLKSIIMSKKWYWKVGGEVIRG
jgi:transposase-like protein